MKKLMIFIMAVAFLVFFSLGTAMASSSGSNYTFDKYVVAQLPLLGSTAQTSGTTNTGITDRTGILLSDQILTVNSEVFYLAPSINWRSYNKLDIFSQGLGVPTPQQVMGYAQVMKVQMHRNYEG